MDRQLAYSVVACLLVRGDAQQRKWHICPLMETVEQDHRRKSTFFLQSHNGLWEPKSTTTFSLFLMHIKLLRILWLTSNLSFSSFVWTTQHLLRSVVTSVDFPFSPHVFFDNTKDQTDIVHYGEEKKAGPLWSSHGWKHISLWYIWSQPLKS